MNRIEAENYIYQSFLRATKFQSYNDKDSNKRDPSITEKLIRSLSQTPCTVVTGSKGKGSVANMISSVLQTVMPVGLMTSPHLVDFCERIRFNGCNISEEDLIRYIEELKPIFDSIDASLPNNRYISPMGIQTAIALRYFQDRQTQFNVFECGKGAQYDDVNNVTHDYAVINSIFLEHTRELGETLSAIASDKANVIRRGMKCVYVAQQQPEALDVIVKRAKDCEVELKLYGRDFRCEKVSFCHQGMNFNVILDNNTIYTNLSIPLLGEHQARNCALALALCHDVLGSFDLETVKCSLAGLSWPGRMEVLSSSPFVLLDACINRESCNHVLQVLQHLGIDRFTALIGIPNDKDYVGVAEKMHHHASRVVLTQSHNPHYCFSELQKKVLSERNIDSEWFEDIEKGVQFALSFDEPLVILGTTSVVSEAHALFYEKGKNM